MPLRLRTLPGVFRQDDPVLDLLLAPNDEVQLCRLLDELPAEIFRTDDALGWTYQFWQAKRKDEVNESGDKIGAEELPRRHAALHRGLHGGVPAPQHPRGVVGGERLKDEGGKMKDEGGEDEFATEEDARRFVALPGCSWDYLRFVKVPPDDDAFDSPSSFIPHPSSFLWTPAAGTFDGWPKRTAEIRFLDPCMGSGHFLVFALPILARLRMEEEGLSAAEAVAAVLRDNLHGLEIDERCTQIAAFSVALTAAEVRGLSAIADVTSGLLRPRAEHPRRRLAGVCGRQRETPERHGAAIPAVPKGRGAGQSHQSARQRG